MRLEAYPFEKRSIIYRMKYKDSLTQEWLAKFHALTGSGLLEAK